MKQPKKDVSKKEVPKKVKTNLDILIPFNGKNYVYGQLKVLTSKIGPRPMELKVINGSSGLVESSIVNEDIIRVIKTNKGYVVLTGMSRIAKAIEANEDTVSVVVVKETTLALVAEPPKKLTGEELVTKLSGITNARFTVKGARRTLADTIAE
jgi:hypothetical protein